MCEKEKNINHNGEKRRKEEEKKDLFTITSFVRDDTLLNSKV